MKRRSQKRILFLLFCIAIAASLILFKDRSNELHDDLAKQTPEQTTSLVSFQEPVEIKPALKKIEIGLEAVHHRRLPSNVERLGLKKSSTAVKKTKDTKSIFQINGQTLYLLPNLAAVRTKKNQSQKVGQVEGFKFIPSVRTDLVEKYDENLMPIFTDRFAINKFVLTGAIIVELKDFSKVDALSKEFGLDVTYRAPDIKTAIYQIRDGQSILKLKSLMSVSKEVSSLKLELLGKGVEAK